MRLLRLFALTLALGAVASGAQAQPAPPPGWEFSITPYGWLPSLRGNLQTPLPRVGDRSLSIEAGTVISDLDALPAMIAGEARYGRFSLLGDFFYATLAQDLNTRDFLWQGGHTRVTSTIGTLLGMFRILEEPRQSVDIGAGTRIWGFTTKISLNPGLEPGVIRKASVNWADPLVAARYHAMLSPRFGVTVYADAGGFDTGSRLTWQAIGSLDYDLTNWATLRAGWRYLNVDKRNASGSIGLDLGFNGPFSAATFRF
jgi:opacity protein-like surface antigen